MVIDNADNAQFFFGGQLKHTTLSGSNIDEKFVQYVPECGHGAVLVTTRNKQIAVKLSKSTYIMEVRKMDEQESIKLLQI